MTRGLAIIAAASPGFNSSFYETVAGIIPVLFIAIAVEGRLIRGLSDASVWVINLGAFIAQPLITMALLWPVARESVAKIKLRPSGAQHEGGHLPTWAQRWVLAPLLLAMMLGYAYRPRRKQPQPQGVSQTAREVLQQHGPRIDAQIQRAAIIIAFAIACLIFALAAGIAGVGIASEVLVILALYHGQAWPWTGTFVVSATIALVGGFAVGPTVGLINSAVSTGRRIFDKPQQDKAAVPDDQVTTPQPPDTAEAPSL
jgi:hypothetical protein